MVFILFLPFHARYGLVLQSSLGSAEDGKIMDSGIKPI
jgi:hypothetical protein